MVRPAGAALQEGRQESSRLLQLLGTTAKLCTADSLLCDSPSEAGAVPRDMVPGEQLCSRRSIYEPGRGNETASLAAVNASGRGVATFPVTAAADTAIGVVAL